MQVPLLDLKAQYESIRGEVEAAVADVFETQRFIMGPRVELCEAAVAAYSQCAFGVGVSSGTDALLVALMAESLAPGDEVITTPYSFFATAGCVARLGATPVFVDIEPTTFNLDPAAVEAAVTPRTKAIIPVHLFGQTAEMDPILATARKHGLVVLEDAAQAIGAEYHGRRAGNMGDYGCFSFFPSKNLGAAGDGGMIVTSDTDKAERLRMLRNHGAAPKYYHSIIGGNFRLDALQAAVVHIKLGHLDAWSRTRQHNAERYNRLIERAGLTDRITLPAVKNTRHIFNQYVIRLQQRDEAMAFLRENGVGCEVYYPVPLHRQECFAYLGYDAGSLPESECAARETLALPVYPELTDEQAEYVVAKLAEFCA